MQLGRKKLVKNCFLNFKFGHYIPFFLVSVALQPTLFFPSLKYCIDILIIGAKISTILFGISVIT